MKKSNLKGSLILCLAALIWGLAFSAQEIAANKGVTPFALNALRSFVGAIFLYCFLKIKGIKSCGFKIFPNNISKKIVLSGSILCGLMLCISVNLQQVGISSYSPEIANSTRSGFLTALYVIIVPIISVVLRKKIPFAVWGAVILAVIGVYLLCMSGPNKIQTGDVFMLCCALSFSIHILVVDKFCDLIGGIRLSMLQFIVCGILSSVLSLIFEFDSLIPANIICAMPQILYLGIMSSGIAYTLQIVGQQYAEPAIASISMSFESVFAAIGGCIIAHDVLRGTEIVGCVLMFAAIVLAQIPEFLKKKIHNS